MWRSAIFSTLFVASCTSPDAELAEPVDPLAQLFAGELTVVDMTHALSASMPHWPGPSTNPFVHDTLAAHESGAPMMAAISTPEHHGTHLDAPIHGGDGLPSVDALSAAQLFGPAVVVDVTEAVSADPDYAATAGDLAAWESRNGTIPEGAVVLLRTGWGARWPDQDRYMAVDEGGTLHFPGFSPEAARFLIEERSIRGIGADTPSVDPGAADGFPVHGIVNGSGRYQLENVANVDQLPESGAYLIVAPVKIEGGSGGPVRIFGVVP